MNQKLTEEAEKICEAIFPENEVGQCVLHHYLACFAELVEVQAMIKFRDELSSETSGLPYHPEEVRHG